MKKAAIISSSVLTGLIITSFSNVYAGNSSSSVKINNTINSSNSSSSVSQTNSHSKVTITCNGKTYTYESNGESIDANPCEGSSVKINNNDSVQSTQITPPNPTEFKEQIDKKKIEIKKKIEVEKEKIKATITAIPKPTSIPRINFDLGAFLRTFILSLFK